MARVLVAGCGYVGEAAANQFNAYGWEVEGWTGSADSASKLSARPYVVRAVDIGDKAALAAAFGEFDVVIHCVSSRGGDERQYKRLYFDGAKNLQIRFPEATILFTSSTSVYGQTDGSVVDETSPAEPRHEKGKILRETEDLIRASGGIVLRLAGIHGPARSVLVTKFLRSEMTAGDPERLINQIHRDDIVSALLLLADRREENRGEIFNVAGDQAITSREACDWLAPRLRRPLPVASASPFPSKRGESNKQVSNQKLRALGWTPRYPNFQAAMSESILPSLGF